MFLKICGLVKFDETSLTCRALKLFDEGALGFSVLRFRPFFRLVFLVFVPKNFGLSVLVTIAVCGFCFISLSVFDLRQK